MQNTPLDGYRVLDMSRVLAGPWTGQLLADMGADVIKIERPKTGDDTRHWGPPFLKNEQGENTAESAYYLAANRGKQSVTVDITTTEGQEIIIDLARKSDILLENYKVDGLAKYGLDYATLSKVNPRLIYCSITGFGQTGPYAQRPGYDFLIQAMGGLMSITGQPENTDGGGPVKVGVAITDIVTGLYATIAIQSALIERQSSGKGQHLDLSLLDCSVAVLANQATNYLVGQLIPQRLGNAHPNIVPYQAFATADGHIILAVGNDSQFNNLCKLLNLTELATDERAATNPQRVKNRDYVVSQLQEAIQNRATVDLLELCEQYGVPCGPINNIEQTFNDPGVKERGMRRPINHPDNNHLELPGNPIHFSRSRLNQDQPPPLLGQHTENVLGSLLGYSSEKLGQLKKKGCI